MNIVWTIVLSFLAGVIAKFIYPGKENMGFVMTILLGIAGSFVASYGGQWLKLYQPGQAAGFIGSVVGALVLLFVHGLIKPSPVRTSPFSVAGGESRGRQPGPGPPARPAR